MNEKAKTNKRAKKKRSLAQHKTHKTNKTKQNNYLVYTIDEEVNYLVSAFEWPSTEYFPPYSRRGLRATVHLTNTPPWGNIPVYTIIKCNQVQNTCVKCLLHAPSILQPSGFIYFWMLFKSKSSPWRGLRATVHFSNTPPWVSGVATPQPLQHLPTWCQSASHHVGGGQRQYHPHVGQIDNLQIDSLAPIPP